MLRRPYARYMLCARKVNVQTVVTVFKPHERVREAERQLFENNFLIIYVVKSERSKNNPKARSRRALVR